VDNIKLDIYEGADWICVIEFRVFWW